MVISRDIIITNDISDETLSLQLNNNKNTPLKAVKWLNCGSAQRQIFLNKLCTS